VDTRDEHSFKSTLYIPLEAPPEVLLTTTVDQPQLSLVVVVTACVQCRGTMLTFLVRSLDADPTCGQDETFVNDNDDRFPGMLVTYSLYCCANST
jgi:hypothetical protein